MRQRRRPSRSGMLFMTIMLNFVVLFRIASSSSSSSSINDGYPDIQVLVYETADRNNKYNYFTSPVRSFVSQIGKQLNGIDVTVFGNSDSFEGYGSKFVSVLPILQSMEDQETLVVITDSRDVLVNNPYNVDTYVDTLANEFRWAFYELTMYKPGAIVVSAEAQCCVSALTHVLPGSYYNPDGTRRNKACWSGKQDCQWISDDNAAKWEHAMYDVMIKQRSTLSAALTSNNNITYDDLYLNAGLVAGKAKDLIRILQAAQIGSTEDDQAVLTDYMIQNPDDIILDYEQTMFGNNRVGIQSTDEDSRCVFSLSQPHQQQGRLVHTKTSTTPLFVHSPGGYYSCHDHLAQLLGIPAISSDAREFLQHDRDLTSNYKSPTKAPITLSELLTRQKPAPTPMPQGTSLTNLLGKVRTGF